MPDIRKILCAVDFSPATPEVARWCGHLARATKAEVLVLYVAPTLQRYLNFQVSADSLGALVDTVAQNAREHMGRCLKDHFPGLPVQGRVTTGYPPEAIVDMAMEEGCDLIVIGTHGRRGLDRIVFGSVAEKVVKKSPIPVFTIRPLG